MASLTSRRMPRENPQLAQPVRSGSSTYVRLGRWSLKSGCCAQSWCTMTGWSGPRASTRLATVAAGWTADMMPKRIRMLDGVGGLPDGLQHLRPPHAVTYLTPPGCRIVAGLEARRRTSGSGLRACGYTVPSETAHDR